VPTPITRMMGPGQEPIFEWGPPYPYPWIPESEPLVTALGLALLVAAVWPTILVPLGAATALTLLAAHAAPRSSSATPASSSEAAASR
jgi:hypothetical protein